MMTLAIITFPDRHEMMADTASVHPHKGQARDRCGHDVLMADTASVHHRAPPTRPNRTMEMRYDQISPLRNRLDWREST